MSLKFDPDATCSECGCFGAYRFETETLCETCYAGRGSCCTSEFTGPPPSDETCDLTSAPKHRPDGNGKKPGINRSN